MNLLRKVHDCSATSDILRKVKRFVKLVNSSYTLCGASRVTKTEPDVPLKVHCDVMKATLKGNGETRTERLEMGTKALHLTQPYSLDEAISLGYGRGLTGHRAAQWMDIYITLAGLLDESVF